MSAPTAQVEVWVLVDEDGNYAAAKDPKKAKELYDEDYCDSLGFRLIKLVLTVPQPVHIEVSGTVTDKDGPVELVVS